MYINRKRRIAIKSPQNYFRSLEKNITAIKICSLYRIEFFR